MAGGLKNQGIGPPSTGGEVLAAGNAALPRPTQDSPATATGPLLRAQRCRELRIRPESQLEVGRLAEK